MAEENFVVELAKLKLIEANVKRVNHLFHVDISIIVHDEADHAKIYITSSNGSNLSQKNIKNAQTYLLAALELSENFTREKIFLPKDQSTMVLNEKNYIEETYQVVLFDGNGHIIVQGERKCVNMACDKVFLISDEKRTLTSLICDADPLMLYDFKKMDIQTKGENVDSSPSHSSEFMSENYDKVDSRLLGLGCGEEGKYLYRLEDDTLETDCYASPSINLLSVCSHETEADRILSDPQNSPQIEKALRLGYNEHHIVAVLKKLKVSAMEVDSNTLLSELIKVGDLSSETQEAFPLDNEEDETEDILLEDDAGNLRHIVIDGSNVAMSHGNKDVFSCRGIQLAVDYFQNRGHKKITVFVPQWRKEFSRNNSPITDQNILKNLEREKKLKFTPSRRISGRRVVCYDDRFILELAHSQNGIIVSNDNYRDLHNEKKEYKKVAEEQLLQYLFVDDKFMPPQDPLGRHGPTLDNFLRIRPIVSEPQLLCPYGKKCTYGNKCRFSHPERGNRPHRSVTEMLTEQSSQKLKDRAIKMEEMKKKDMSKRKQNLRRTQSMFPDEHGIYDSFSLNTSYEENKLLKKTLSYASDYCNKEILSSQQLHRETVVNTSHDSSPAPISVPRVSIQTENYTEVQNEPIKTSHETKLEVMNSTSPPPIISTHTSKLGSEEVLVTGHLSLAKKLSDDAQDRPSKFFDSDKDDNTYCVKEHQKAIVDSTQIKTDFKKAVPHQKIDHNLPASDFRFTSNESGSIFHSCPPTVMRHNTMIQLYDNPCRSFSFHEREYSALNKELHASDIQARCAGSSSKSPHPAQIQSNLFLRQSSFTGQHLNSTGMEQISSHGNASVMFPHQHSMLPYDGSMPVNQPIAQQPFLYTRQNSEVPYQTDQQYYSLLHQTPPPYPIYQPPYINSQPSVQMQTILPARQSMVGHGTTAQQSEYARGYPSVLSPPVTQATREEILPTDPRYPVFYHLCQLFNEEEVKAAMTAYPHETDPKTLVSFILQLKHIPS